jgi:hypothetical protein
MHNKMGFSPILFIWLKPVLIHDLDPSVKADGNEKDRVKANPSSTTATNAHLSNLSHYEPNLF